MGNNNEQIKSFKIKELFESTEQYIIPIYQRNYAWQKAQVVQLIQDILDVAKIDDKTYYIGSLIVYKRVQKDNTVVYETIDGQQRLTTLSILLSVLKNTNKLKDYIPHQILNFESREVSKNTLNAMYHNQDLEKNVQQYNATMKQAYIEIQNKLEEDSFDIDKFVKFLLENVEILRVAVPEDTDLNHYFEIMNNRGEQLEKHEVLKAKMMSALNTQERSTFSKIWDACSDMSRYVQYGFNPEDRKKIFGNQWNSFKAKDFNNILKSEENHSNIPEENLSLEDIVKKEIDKNPSQKNERDLERFISPINFQNFLLHVLRIQIKDTADKVALDDKRLLDIFEEYLKDKDKNFVKQFAFNLLKMKYLFDNFILKRDYSKNSDDGEWSLLKLLYGKSSTQYNNTFQNEENNKKILMLLSMFHVSNPSQNYKHWLTGVLNFLFNLDDINQISSTQYITYLERMAKLFFMNRYLAESETNYSEIVFNPNLQINKNIHKDNLNQGTKVENFIFNYLDYLLWDEKMGSYNTFSFSFKSSVEHVYPQHPKDGQEELDKEILDSFGNLCLISASKNSELSNYMPIAKRDHYHKTGYDSLKQELMMEKAEKWNEVAIKEHQEEMEKILFKESEQ